MTCHARVRERYIEISLQSYIIGEWQISSATGSYIYIEITDFYIWIMAIL